MHERNIGELRRESKSPTSSIIETLYHCPLNVAGSEDFEREREVRKQFAMDC